MPYCYLNYLAWNWTHTLLLLVWGEEEGPRLLFCGNFTTGYMNIQIFYDGWGWKGREGWLQEVLLRIILTSSIHMHCTACTVIYINFASRHRQQKRSAPFPGDSRIHHIVGTTRSFSPSNPKLVLHSARTSGGDRLALLWWQTIQSN